MQLKPSKKQIPQPPAHLSRAAKTLWRNLHSEWVLDEPGSIAILVVGLESFDRCQDARKILAAEGLATRDRFGQVRVHPLAAVARDAEAAFRSALRQLGVDKPPDDTPSRRPGRPTMKGGL
jgi:P27 family predicted phage terminase small subunit